MAIDDRMWQIVEDVMKLIDMADNNDPKLVHYWNIVDAAKSVLAL